MKPKIIVSHPGKQYVHQLLFALQSKGYLQLFFTSIWYKPTSLIYKFLVGIPVAGPFIFNKFLRKKTYEQQNDHLIVQFPLKEVQRQMLVQISTKYRLEKYVLEVEKAHDLHVAKRIKGLKPDVFIGYEKSSLESFKEVKRIGGITVLDLAQVHYQYLIELSEKEETFQDLFNDELLFNEINRIKAEEYQHADYILTLSELAKHTLISNGIEPGKIRVINLGYNPSIFTPKRDYKPSSGLRLIYTGTFTKRKGVHLLLQCIREMNIKDLHLTIIGPVLDGEELFTQYKDCFEYFDFLHHEELVKHLHNADVYIFPSYLDSWAMTVIEAMACGLPVIVTDHTGAKDAVENNTSGLIIRSGDIDQLKQSILHFYNNTADIQRMGVNASVVAKQYTWEYYHRAIDKFIKEIS